jgi:hypothetical protein
VQKHFDTPLFFLANSICQAVILIHHNESTYRNARLTFHSWLDPASGGSVMQLQMRGVLG